MKNERIIRNSKAARLVHWIHTISCLMLFYTGLAIFSPKLNGLAWIFGGLEHARAHHRVAAIVFIAIPALAIIFNFKGFLHMLGSIFSWDSDDTKWLIKAPAYMFKSSIDMPPQGKLKAVQKLAYMMVLFSSVVMVVTGIILWYPASYTPNALLWSVALHDLFMIITGVVLLGHMYIGLGIFQPYRGAWRLMFGDGTISEEAAEFHNAKWFQKVKAR
ncbi:cytochrome b/b6 domain-containing protein [bacterium]|nr:cytochrome b/b6 domain-containing protein [bacterium]